MVDKKRASSESGFLSLVTAILLPIASLAVLGITLFMEINIPLVLGLVVAIAGVFSLLSLLVSRSRYSAQHQGEGRYHFLHDRRRTRHIA